MEGSSVHLKGNNIVGLIFTDADLEIHLVLRFIELWLESWTPNMNPSKWEQELPGLHSVAAWAASSWITAGRSIPSGMIIGTSAPSIWQSL